MIDFTTVLVSIHYNIGITLLGSTMQFKFHHRLKILSVFNHYVGKGITSVRSLFLSDLLLLHFSSPLSTIVSDFDYFSSFSFIHPLTAFITPLSFLSQKMNYTFLFCVVRIFSKFYNKVPNEEFIY